MPSPRDSLAKDFAWPISSSRTCPAIENQGKGNHSTANPYCGNPGSRFNSVPSGAGAVFDEEDLFQLVGRPTRTQTISGHTTWYWRCSDGTVEMQLNAYGIQRAVQVKQGWSLGRTPKP